MARGKVRNRDLADDQIDGSKIIDGTITIVDLKLLDAGDSSGVNAETLPYDHTSATPTIWTKINAIILATGYVFDEWVSSAISTDYVLAGSKQFDVTKFLLVFYNGQFMKQGVSDDYQIVTTAIADDTIRFNFTIETGYQIYTVFEALP